MGDASGRQDRLRQANLVRKACIKAATEAYEDAKLRGLCHEGAWELAIQAMRELKLDLSSSGDEPRRPDGR